MANEIVLPSGTEYVATADVPELLARALHPETTGQPLTVSYFIKTARRGATGETAKWNGWPIDDDDRRVLAHLWADLPTLPDHATADEVRPYIEKANRADLDWTLDVCWNNPSLNSSIIRPEAEKEHRQAIVAAIRRGDLKVVAPHTRLATDEFRANSQVSVEELRRYVAQFKIVVRLESPAEAMPITTAELMTEQATLWERREPAHLFGEGFSREMRNLTTLSRYQEFDTWTPEAAAMLVCGLQAPIVDGHLCTQIPEKGAMGLDNCFIMGSQDPFHEAKRVLGIWRSQENSPAKVRPLEFIVWCQARGFDTSWLRTIKENAFNAGREAMKAALGSGVVVIPRAPLLSAEWLAAHIALSLVTIPDDERLTTVFKETVVKQEPGLTQSTREALTSADWHLVRSICGNPPVRCSRAQFDEWRGKFEATENRPGWTLAAEFRESAEMANAQARWCDVSVAHKQQIAQWVSDGDLSLVTADGVETVDTTKGFIRLDDVKRYLEHYNLPWRDTQVKAEDSDRSLSANGQPKSLEHRLSPDARELSTIGLTREQWNRMTGMQRQKALQAIADTKAHSELVARQALERRALGRYTLNEAANEIAASGERLEALLEKLCGAAKRGDLPMHAPNELARYLYENGRPVRPFYEEVYWNDLNAWLDKSEPRLMFRFAKPNMSVNIATQEAFVANRSPDGLPAREEDQATPSGPGSFTKHAIGTRSNPLKAVIEKAKDSAADPSDIHSVWAAFVKLARDANRPAPLLGYADAEGIKWDANGTVKFFTKKNLADRMRRANAR
jgi:hypothetical protein